jgi:parallel beta-helix repeat protein
MHIQGCREGIEVREASYNGTITRNVLEDMRDDGISVIMNAYNITISNNEIFGNTGVDGSSSGIEIEDGSYQISVIGNRIHDSAITGTGGNGIAIALDPASSYNASYSVAIVGNVVDNVENKGIYAVNQKSDFHHDITVSGNVVVNIAGAGIYMDNVRGVAVSGNTIQGCGGGIFYAGTATTNGVQHSTITANTIRNSTNEGINLFNSTYIKIADNVIIDADTAEAYQYGIKVNNTSQIDVYVDILSNTLLDTTTPYTMRGISITNANDVNIKDNTLKDLSTVDGALITASSASTDDVIIQDNIGGVWIWDDNPSSKGNVKGFQQIRINDNDNDGTGITATVEDGVNAGQKMIFRMQAGDADDSTVLTFTGNCDRGRDIDNDGNCTATLDDATAGSEDYLIIMWDGDKWQELDSDCTWTDT